jgi:hypothetical protein
MSKIIKVTIEYEDKIYIAEGEDAESWSKYVDGMSGIAMVHGDIGWNQWTKVEKKNA